MTNLKLFEGVSCPIAKRVVSSLERGIPVSVSVFEGNSGDPKTLLPQIEKVQERFGIESL